MLPNNQLIFYVNYCKFRTEDNFDTVMNPYGIVERIYRKNISKEIDSDHLLGIVVSTSDSHPGFDSRLYTRIFSGIIGPGMGPLSLVRTIG